MSFLKERSKYKGLQTRKAVFVTNLRQKLLNCCECAKIPSPVLIRIRLGIFQNTFDKYFDSLYNILNKTTGTIAETYPFLVQ